MAIQVFGAPAAVIMLNRAFTDTSPGNLIYTNQVAAATANLTAFANEFGAAYASLSNAALAERVLGNLGLLPNAALQTALADYYAAAGLANRGFVTLQLGQILAAKEGDATYGAAAAAWNDEVASGFNYSANTANTGASGSGSVGQTFTLTTDIATVTGGAGADTFVGAIVYSAGAQDGSTLNAGDSIEGGGGIDTLKIAISGSALPDGGDSVTPLLSGIEKVLVASNETDARSTNNVAHNVTIDLASAGADLTTVGTYASTAAGDLTFSNVGKVVDIEAAGRGDLTVSYATGVTSGDANEQTITLNGVGTSNSSRSTIISGGIETVNVVATGSTSFANLGNNAAKSISISGASALTLGVGGAGATELKTVDASKATGAITLDSLPATDITITGGAGNDTVRLNGANITSTDSIDLGAGTNTVQLLSGAIGSAAAGSGIKNITNLYGARLFSADENSLNASDDYLAITQNASVVSGVTTVGTNAWTIIDSKVDDTNDVAVVDSVTFAGLTPAVTTLNLSGISYTGRVGTQASPATGGLTFNAAVTLASDTQADSLNVVLGTATAAAYTATGGDEALNTLSVSAVDQETLTITSQGGANTVTTLTVGDLQKLTINATKALTVTSIVGASAQFKSIDASASTANVSLTTNGLGGAGTVLGGAGNDVLSGSGLNDSISGGAGNDSLSGSGGNDTINGDAGNDTITGGDRNDRLFGGDGNDAISAGEGGVDSIDAGAGDDRMVFGVTANGAAAVITGLASTDTLSGGEGNDSIYFSGTFDADPNPANTVSLNFDLQGTGLTSFSNVSGAERLEIGVSGTATAADTVTVNVGDVLLGSFGNNLTVSWAATNTTGFDVGNRAYSVAVDASNVLNTGSSVTTSAPTGRALTYTVGNAIDKATGGTLADTFVVTNNLFLQATDVLKGGSGADTLRMADQTGGTFTEVKLATLSSVETISIDTDNTAAPAGADAGKNNYSFTLTDTIVGANYNTSTNSFTITRDATDNGNLKVDGSAVTSAYNLVLTAGSGATKLSSTAAATGDTLIGGAGNDIITGGDGLSDTIDLTAGGNDRVVYLSDFDGGESADVVTGFTTHTASATSSTVQTGFDMIVFGVPVSQINPQPAQVFGAGLITFANTLSSTVLGVTTTLDADDYNEFAGAATSVNNNIANNLIAASEVNVIRGRGYDSIESAYYANVDESQNMPGAFVVFYNTGSQQTEVYYADPLNSYFPLLAQLPEITLAGIGGLSASNFGVLTAF